MNLTLIDPGQSYTVKQAAVLLGVPYERLKTDVRRKRVASELIQRGNKSLLVIPGIVLLSLQAATIPEGNTWERSQADFLNGMRQGIITGRQNGPRSIANLTFNLKKYFSLLGVEADEKHITAENLQAVFAGLPVNYTERHCHYATKDNLQKAVKAFMLYMVSQGKRTGADVAAVAKLKPKRLMPARKTVLKDDGLEKLLKQNRTKLNGRCDYDADTCEILIALMGYGGLRLNEAITLEGRNISLKRSEMTVFGKGYTLHTIGILPELRVLIQSYFKVRPKSKSPTLLVKLDGDPFTISGASSKIKRLAKACKIEITPHGLRRTAATLLATRYKLPPIAIQKTLRHKHFSTTESYIMTSEQDAAELVKAAKPATI